MLTRHYQELRLKMVITTLCFALIPLLALGLTIYYQFTTAYELRTMEAVRTMAQNRVNSVELFLEERIAQLVTVANTHTYEQLRNEQYLQKVFKVMQHRSKSYIDLGVIDQNGDHIAYTGPHYSELKGVNYGKEAWFQAVMASSLYVSDVFLGFRKVPHFIIAVTNHEGNKTWILRATINSDIIDNMVRRAQVGRKGDAFIINRENVLQTTPRFNGKVLGKPNAPNFSAVVDTIVERADSGGEESLFAASSISNPRWVLVIKEDLREAMAPLFRARHVEVIILLAGIGLVVAGTLIITRSLTNELMKVETEKAKSDELVVQSAKMAALGKLAAGVAHEVNNPLQIISEQAGWMKDILESDTASSQENQQELKQCIRKIERQVERSRAITHRLLGFGRRMEPTQEMVDVNGLVAETVKFLENEAHHRGIDIQDELDQSIPKITTDPSQLQQVLLNIMDNAIDASGKGDVIKVVTSYNSQDPRLVTVRVSDQGIGIPKDKLNRIFDPFFTTKGPSEGTGLGLSISYSIMEKLGGRIAVESEEGMGTTFTLFIPTES
ncbi:MAG: ATP-binding protein [Thermodesulfobacteriota bacterium]